MEGIVSQFEFDEPAIRLVYTDIGLPELFARSATDAGLASELLLADDVAATVIPRLEAVGARRVYLPPSSLLGRLELSTSLASAGFEVIEGNPMGTAPIDAAVTDCFAAIAETGSLAFELSATSRRVLAARVRIAVVEPRACVADLLDLMERVRQRPGELFIESGPTDFVALVLN
jgi:L-lactate utilization protein LutC